MAGIGRTRKKCWSTPALKPCGPLRALAALLLALAAIAAVPAGASAALGEYRVELCTQQGHGDDIERFEVGNPAPMFMEPCGNTSAATIRQGTNGGKAAGNTTLGWSVESPSHTVFKEVELDTRFDRTTPSFLDWDLVSAKGALLHVRDDSRPLPGPSHRRFFVGSTLIAGQLSCLTSPGVTTCPGEALPGSFLVTLSNLEAVLVDEGLPFVAPSALAGRTLRGVADVPVSAADTGSGLAEVSVFVDGVERANVVDGNGGRCQAPYRFLVPCKLTINAPVALDTTKLADGPHTIEVAAVDASGLTDVSDPVTFTVRNAPQSDVRPAIAGTAQVGRALEADTGAWEGQPTRFAYQWLRCPATVTTADEGAGCAAVAAATGTKYLPAETDAGQRLEVRVTATNASGSATATSAPTAPVASGKDVAAPLLKRVSLSRRRLRFGRGSKSAATALRFTSSEGGKLTIVLERLRGHRKARPVLSLAADVNAGPTKVPLGASLAAGRLKPGGYRLSVTVRDAAGNLSKPARLPLKILGRR